MTIAREARFWASVDRSGPGCWPWLGSRFKTGLRYGQVRDGKRTFRAHRVAYELVYGELPPGAVVRHRCDNPICVRPSHLTKGTHAENMADRDARGRTARGERIATGKLTADAVREILGSLAAGQPARSVAAAYGVTPGAVRQIAAGRTWRHVQLGAASDRRRQPPSPPASSGAAA